MGLRASAGWPSWIARVSCLAAGYYVAGRLGLLMAIPPGYATAVWPAAGIGLIGILVWGRQAWPAIVLGAFCISLPISLGALAHGPAMQAWLVAACVSAGAALQAVVGAELVRRWVSYSSLLAREVEIIKFLLLAGPVACLVSATAGVFALRSAGVIDESDMFFNWWTWWVGDTIGVLLVVPVFLTWGASPAQLSWQTKLYLSLPLTALCGLVVASFIYTSGLEQRRIQADFVRRSEQLTRVLSLKLSGYSEVLKSLGDFVASSPELDRQRFATFVGRPLKIRPGIQALAWNPLVTDEERAAFEAAARADGNPDYRITELGPDGRLGLAAHRPSYVAVRYIEPYADNFQALGLDIASSPVRRAALLRAGRTPKAFVSACVTRLRQHRSNCSSNWFPSSRRSLANQAMQPVTRWPTAALLRPGSSHPANSCKPPPWSSADAT